MRNKLTAAEYWEYRLSAEEIGHAETQLQLKHKTFALMDKDIEIQRLKLGLYRSVINIASEGVSQKKKDYEIFKEELEKKLGQSISGKIITEDFKIEEID